MSQPQHEPWTPHPSADPASAPAGYEQSVAIWRGRRPVANGGWLTIGGGLLGLYDGKGRLLVESRVSDVSYKKSRFTIGSGLSMFAGGERYMVSPGSGDRPPMMATTGSSNPGLGTGTGAAAVAHGRSFVNDLVSVLDRHGASSGKLR